MRRNFFFFTKMQHHFLKKCNILNKVPQYFEKKCTQIFLVSSHAVLSSAVTVAYSNAPIYTPKFN
jgi:hypothetical protein